MAMRPIRKVGSTPWELLPHGSRVDAETTDHDDENTQSDGYAYKIEEEEGDAILGTVKGEGMSSTRAQYAAALATVIQPGAVNMAIDNAAAVRKSARHGPAGGGDQSEWDQEVDCQPVASDVAAALASNAAIDGGRQQCLGPSVSSEDDGPDSG